jgi:hypothetical protein
MIVAHRRKFVTSCVHVLLASDPLIGMLFGIAQ